MSGITPLNPRAMRYRHETLLEKFVVEPLALTQSDEIKTQNTPFDTALSIPCRMQLAAIPPAGLQIRPQQHALIVKYIESAIIPS